MLSMIVLNAISAVLVLGKQIRGPGTDRGVIFQSPSLMSLDDFFQRMYVM
jgi:nitrate/nitrite transport system ATP-binding protein